MIADGAADAQLVAADLVAQAEHGPHGTHALVTWDPALADRVLAALELAVVRHRDADAVENALIEGGRLAYRAGRIPRRLHAEASTPEYGVAEF